MNSVINSIFLPNFVTFDIFLIQDTCFMLDLSAEERSWVNLTTGLANSRAGTTMLPVNNEAYIMGTSASASDSQTLDFSTGLWTQIPEMLPEPKQDACFCSRGASIFMLGGVSDNGT